MLCHHLCFVPNAQAIPKQIAFRIGNKTKCSTSFKIKFSCLLNAIERGAWLRLSVASLLLNVIRLEHDFSVLIAICAIWSSDYHSCFDTC